MGGDPAAFAALEQALALSPGNAVLRGLVLKAALDAGLGAAAWTHIQDLLPEALASDADRQLAARVALAAGQPAIAEAFASAGGAHIADGVVRSGANEAPEAAKVVPFGKPRLRVISNDEDARSDVSRLLEPEPAPITFADVGGLDGLKEQIRRKIILPFSKPSLFDRFKKRVGGGILMYGPPGCGKTLLARATAGECGATFFNVAISDVLDMYLGESEQKLHALFEKARQSKPAVLFFDEIEALGGKREFSRESTTAKVVSQFLAEMDGLATKNQGVLVLGATNVPWAVDPAFRRPGRFDRVQFVPPPDKAARLDILQLLLAGRPTAGQLPLDELSQKTSGFSGADLQNLVETAVDEAIQATLAAATEVPVSADHLRRALKEVKPTTVEWLNTARNYARYANESGQYDEVLEFLSKHGVVR